jgi:hypothetical protein
MSSQHWDAGSIGIVLTISGVTTAVTRGPGRNEAFNHAGNVVTAIVAVAGAERCRL